MRNDRKTIGERTHCLLLYDWINFYHEKYCRSVHGRHSPELPLKDEIHDALQGKENQLKDVLDLVEAVEQAEWKAMADKCRKLNLHVRELFRIYAESSNWATKMIDAEKIASFESDPFVVH